GRFAGAARCRPNGRLSHAASRTWDNMRKANGKSCLQQTSPKGCLCGMLNLKIIPYQNQYD
ncbi:hypothetical protein, partial [Anaerotruncus colihominis]|uniref:hypothetical protein n=1 Tax=Anaerotruncus colihominis TaxID=169435 RepID=UPI001A9AC0D6